MCAEYISHVRHHCDKLLDQRDAIPLTTTMMYVCQRLTCLMTGSIKLLSFVQEICSCQDTCILLSFRIKTGVGGKPKRLNFDRTRLKLYGCFSCQHTPLSNTTTSTHKKNPTMAASAPSQQALPADDTLKMVFR